ncbi:uncharacterized protein CTRU02_210029 [Colletotrichum truncatum]|uniref:Uncharacterized protein n=1 Tax=Colletotrichum truncatum TaxID=5467 RepID=A0ACC3YU28_COLTU|nr:uncharacterized protein CTRU02_02603 [Colletotrichum truncatum]KAF6798629.1 hypothetical protein CTRU02_02603 [Colletotrichum truncatum]
MKALRTVAIFHIEAPGEVDEDWWGGWFIQMREYYHTDRPVHFYTKIVYPDLPPYEINLENYMNVDRDARRKIVAKFPDGFEEGYEVSDSDDDVRGPDRFYRWASY